MLLCARDTLYVLSLFLIVCVCLSVFECVCSCRYTYIIAKSPSSMRDSKWPTVVHSKQQRLAAFEDRVLSEHRKTFLSLC